MKRINWEERQPGDIVLVRMHGLLPDLISHFESEIHGDFRGGFIPTHAAIMGEGDMVVEAALSLHENSVAAINPASEYASLPVQVWRIERSAVDVESALREFVKEYAKDGYGLLDLLGFALEAVKRHLGNPLAGNHVLVSYVCSQAALLFLRMPAVEKWPLKADLRSCDPLALLMLFSANETKEDG